MTKNIPIHGSILKAGEGIYVASPELCFVQLSAELEFLDLIKFGYELLGIYGFCDRGLNTRLLDLKEPLTTPKRLSDYVQRCNNMKGLQVAKRALPYLMDGSASPAETRFGMSMTLPRNLGGQAIRGLKLNYRIPLTKKQSRIAGKGHYRIDLYDPHTDVGFEYLGEESHAGMIRGVSDLRRESILQTFDVKVHGVTKVQARNLAEVMRFARIVYDARGKQYRKPTSEQLGKMLQLLTYLYPANRWRR